MKIKNKKNSANSVNFKDHGIPKRSVIAAGATVEIKALTSVSQITNYGDFKRGFFEIIEDKQIEAVVSEKKAASTKKKAASTKSKKEEDSLEKVEKEVKNYTDNEE